MDLKSKRTFYGHVIIFFLGDNLVLKKKKGSLQTTLFLDKVALLLMRHTRDCSFKLSISTKLVYQQAILEGLYTMQQTLLKQAGDFIKQNQTKLFDGLF